MTAAMLKQKILDSEKQLESLTEEEKNEYDYACKGVESRKTTSRIQILIDEFASDFKLAKDELIYCLAFRHQWYFDFPNLYGTRHWLTVPNAGVVYWIYDSGCKLKYIGSNVDFQAGKRYWDKKHKGYQRTVDVLLFPEDWRIHCLSFEAFAISRLKPKKNKTFKNLDILPKQDWSKVWNDSSEQTMDK